LKDLKCFNKSDILSNDLIISPLMSLIEKIVTDLVGFYGLESLGDMIEIR
jgi:uncharacterized protein (DUF2132 family)